jgi:raffinose/stachyose/melibiose transport system permease protein
MQSARTQARSLGTASLFLAPGLLLFVAFSLIPTVSVVYYSFLRWNGISKIKTFIGFGNYLKLFRDRIFWQAFANTIEWSAIIVVLNVGLGLLLAAMLARLGRGRLAVQTGLMLPVVQAPITTAIIWRWLYQPDGPLNQLLSASGLDILAMPWLGNPATALPALAVAQSWASMGLSIVIFLAGLQAVEEELYDAAKVDGATPAQSFIHITMPSIRPITAVVFVLTLTAAFKAFDLIWATTEGGPIRASEILSTYMYKRGALENEYGYGSAIAVALLVIVTLAMALYLWLQSRRSE